MAENLLKVSVLWRGNKYVVEMNSGASLKELGHELQKLTDVKADTMRLIVPCLYNKGSKLLSPFSDEHSGLSLQEATIVEGKSVRMMGVSEDEVDKVLQNAKVDSRIAGFDEEEKRLKQRMSDRHFASLKLPSGPYIFCDFRTLQLPGVELNPPPSEALKRMHMLAADPGIVAIMNKHRWRVGIMTEMAPVGYVGISPKCVLGFNMNHGEEISLRLRTDDLKGFRKYESIKKTLLHELAHMVYSEHDANFYALDKQLNQEAASLDWTRSRAHTLSGSRAFEYFQEDLDVIESKSHSQKLGGIKSDQLESARASSVAAAYRRMANASANSLGISESHEEPDPDDSGFNTHQEPDHMELEKEKVVMENPTIVQWKLNEPDPDDNSGNKNEFKLDVNDSQPGGNVEPATKLELTGCRNLADADIHDAEMIRVVPPIINSQTLAPKSTSIEPDPDDVEAFVKSRVVAEPDFDSYQMMETIDSVSQPSKTFDEPDPDDLEAEPNGSGCENITIKREDNTRLNNANGEPDPDEANAGVMLSEPDPDEANAGVMLSEPDPDDNLVQSEGVSRMKIDEPDPDDQELRRIQDSVTFVCTRLQMAIETLRSEVNPTEATTILQTLFKIIRNVVEQPDNIKFKRLRKSNPVIQKNVLNYKAAMEILSLIGFNEDVVLDDIGKAETYLVLKRNDPGLLWLAKSSLEACIAC